MGRKKKATVTVTLEISTGWIESLREKLGLPECPAEDVVRCVLSETLTALCRPPLAKEDPR